MPVPEIPLRELGEAFALLVHTQFLVIGDVDRVGRVAPRRRLGGDPERLGPFGVAIAGIRGDDQVVGGHKIREDVVAHDRSVLVGPGDAVDVPDAMAVVVPE